MEKLERYKGELSLEQLILARNKIIENAKALYEEAMLLYENSKFARTYFLLCIANEELGKSLIVTSAIVDLIAEKIDWHKFWKRLRNHKDKTRMIEHAENIFVSSDENFTAPENIQKLIPVLEELKMASLYSDMFQNNFFEPNELVPQFMVAPYHRLTGNRLEFFSSFAASDETLRNVKKEDILKFQSRLHSIMSDYDNDNSEGKQNVQNIFV